MVIKLSNKGAPKKFFESLNSDNIILYRNAKVIVTVKHIHESNDIYDSIEITPSDFVKNLQNSEEFEKYSNLSKFLFLLSGQIPFTLVTVKVLNGEEEKGQKIDDQVFYGHKIIFILHDLTHINIKLIKHQLLKQINTKQKSKWLPRNTCLQPNIKLIKITQCKMLVDFEKCYSGNLKKLLKMIKIINKKQEPIKFINNSAEFCYHQTDISYQSYDHAIKVITLSLNIYETIEQKFLGGDKLIRNECKNQLFYYKTNFQSFIGDLETVLQMIISEYANFQPASNIAKFLPGLFQSCFYLFTNLLENISLVNEIPECSKVLGFFFKVNKIILELIWFSKQWFYLYNTDSRIVRKVLADYEPSKFTILVNSETINQIDFLYDEIESNIIWMFDQNSLTDCEPKLISDNKKFLLGTTVSNNLLSTKTKNEIFYSSGILTYEIFKNDNKPRFWICSICKFLLQTIHRNPLTVRCQCGEKLFEMIEKYDILKTTKVAHFVDTVSAATVTMDISMIISSQIGEICVDIIDKPREFASINKKLVL